ncbi:hypothetical protein BELL_0290g00080 [Botrytis elliptica]|uniref:Uncharacterized protein n=1 Tax=Botrytis elliptica TaxID=278938 RepID=A0A4Z1JKQ0_9HELO|nr:hypothetical protein BELL_0290g00080 [Botrytis elliptica]
MENARLLQPKRNLHDQRNWKSFIESEHAISLRVPKLDPSTYDPTLMRPGPYTSNRCLCHLNQALRGWVCDKNCADVATVA